MYNKCPSLIRFSSQTVAKPQKLLYKNKKIDYNNIHDELKNKSKGLKKELKNFK